MDEEQSVREAAIRHLLGAAPRVGQIYFVFFDGDSDPGDDFLRRFGGLNVVMRKGSQAAAIGGDGVDDCLYRDRITHEPGTRIDVAHLRWLDDGEAEIFAQWSTNGLHAEGGVFIMRQSAAGWTYVRTKARVVS